MWAILVLLIFLHSMAHKRLIRMIGVVNISERSVLAWLYVFSNLTPNYKLGWKL